jgi:hypothetical protein
MEPADQPPDPSVNFEGWVIYTRRAQGLPARVEDPVVLALIANLIVIQHTEDRDKKASDD